MNFYDNENNIMLSFQAVKCEEVYFPVESSSAIEMFESIHDAEKWAKWIDSSGKADLPPDFYSEELGIMMEVMRVDDHAFLNEKGKVINPVNIRESKIQLELKEANFQDIIPNAQILVNAYSGLPADEDHNYTFYLDNFTRTVKHHGNRILRYRKNHPDKKLAFFIFDESSAYCELSKGINSGTTRYVNELIAGNPHMFMHDAAFINLLMELDLDYLIWYAPFKLLRVTNGNIKLPQVCVYDIKKLDSVAVIQYEKDKVLSVEI